MKDSPACTYLVPFRRTAFSDAEAGELESYFGIVRQAGCDIIVVDGSAPHIFAQYEAAWSQSCRHLPVDPQFSYPNGKVNGVHTGVAAATTEKIILADDDIRHAPSSLTEMERLLDKWDVVRPQNFLCPLPWWGRMEAARMLINRATLRAADYPGTCAFRKSCFEKVGPYDGDVLFDNEEIIRHFARRGASICFANDLFVEKQAPSFRKWLEQRPRQAYEDFGLRGKTALFFALPAIMAIFSFRGGWKSAIGFVGLLAVLSVVIAIVGRLRGSARKFFPLSICAFAPCWVAERTLSTYWAFYWYLKYGGYPFGDRLLSKGIGTAWKQGGRIASRQLREQS